ncbi:MAG: hypothetical protein MZU97_11140 [Bacillus subtilis]|nr:hypothetical protein [Bacillus subtilis]
MDSRPDRDAHGAVGQIRRESIAAGAMSEGSSFLIVVYQWRHRICIHLPGIVGDEQAGEGAEVGGIRTVPDLPATLPRPGSCAGIRS